MDYETQKVIVNNTKQKDYQSRSFNETLQDTRFGKRCEDEVEIDLKSNPDFTCEMYDEFRTDDFKKSAPFDGLIVKKGIDSEMSLQIAKEVILEDVKNNEYGQISAQTRDYINALHVYTVEIKSSRLSDKKKINTKNDDDIINNILKDDYFIQPHFCKSDKEHKINSYDDYLKEMTSKYNLSEKDIDTLEKMCASDIQIRIYKDPTDDKTYLKKYTTKDEIFKNRTVKQMYSKNTQDAIYFTQNLREGHDLKELRYDKLFNDNTNQNTHNQNERNYRYKR